MINKGIVGPSFEGQPYAVNEPRRDDERPVPFENMVYIGDGPSDIPCMSLIGSQNGFVIGVSSQARPEKAWALAYGRRANQMVAADFLEGGQAYLALYQAVRQRAAIIVDNATRSGPVPRH